MKIAVIGTGYVGLVSGVCFAEFGFDVTCVDKNSELLARLSRGESTIYEPGLEQLLQSNLREGRLSFDGDLAAAVQDADVIFVAVGTPSRRGDGEADLVFIMAAADEIASAMKEGAVVVIKSTVTVGTCANVRDRMRAARPGVAFCVASNPEFLREGSAVEDFMHPDRIVVGFEDERARQMIQKVYRPLFLRETPMVFTSLENAEMIKYAANAFLAMKITFINQVADLCEKVGGDVQDVARAIGMDNRIGSKFLHPGPGFGGSCFPKDSRAFAAIGQRHGARQQLTEEVIKINEARKQDLAARIIACAGEHGGKTVAILGVAFKPNTDDVREAPALDIIAALQSAGLAVRAHDPVAMAPAALLLPGVVWCESAYSAVEGADVAVILTEWNAYRALDLSRIARSMRGNHFFDMRNIYKCSEFSGSGLNYHSIGRPTVKAE